MPKFNLNLRDAGSLTETPVNLVIRWNNQKLKIRTGYAVNPKQWDSDKQRLKTSPGIPQRAINQQVNAKLSERITEAETQFIKFETTNGRQPTLPELTDLLNSAFGYSESKAMAKIGLFEFMEQFLKEMAAGVNPKSKQPYSAGTIGTYRQCLTHLRDYAASKRLRLDFDSIDLDFYLSYTEYLSGRGYRPNYIGKLIKMLKTFLNEALERGLTDNINHKKRRFTPPKEKVDNIYLTFDELAELWRLDFSKEPRLENVRDLFLFGCYTGLRFSDFSKVSADNIDLNEGVIEIQTQKTGQLVSIPILPITREILAKYAGKTANSLPNSISNQKFNAYLKEIAERFLPLHATTSKESTIRGKKVSQTVPKWQRVTTHTARRSFATNMFLSGFPAQSIMKITGHRTEASFMTYLKMSPRENAKSILKEWNQKFAANQ
jgi:integrase